MNVCVVGAGIAGLTTAYMLLLEGKTVAVLDDGPMGEGESERTTVHLTNALDYRYCELERLYGEQGSRAAAQSHTAAIRCVEAIITNENIDCDFELVDGYLFVPPDEAPDLLQLELAAAHRAGLTEVEELARAPLVFFDTGPCLRFPQQAQFHPRKYLRGLSHVIRESGGRIFPRTHVARIEGGSLAWAQTNKGMVVLADAVVVATNTPINAGASPSTRLAPCRTYVIGTKVPAGSAPRALYWDTAHPRHYVRVHSFPLGESNEEDCDLLIVGGEDHQPGEPDDPVGRWSRLEKWARQRFPMISEIEYRWSGQVREPIDGLASIGRNPMDKPNIYVALGNSGHGMTHGPIAGLLLADLICGRENEWADLYDPGRLTFALPKITRSIPRTWPSTTRPGVYS